MHALSDNAPVSIVIIDAREPVEAFLLGASDLLEGALVVVDDVTIVRL